VVQEPVEERGGDDGIAEDLAPFGKAAVRGQDHGALLIAGVATHSLEARPRRRPMSGESFLVGVSAVLVNPDGGRVDHRQVAAIGPGHGFEDPVPDPNLAPAPEPID